jgi:type I restriction enzyme S subunit
MNVAELIASSGSGMFASITGKNLKEFKVNLPPLPEQKRIVNLISSVDSYIECMKGLIDSAHSIRSSVSESIWNSFKIRSRLSSFGETLTGSTPPTKNAHFWDNHDVDFFTPGDIGTNLKLNKASRGVSSQGAAVSRPLNGYSVLQVCIGATIGKVGFLNFPAVTNQQINALTNLTEHDAPILAAILSSETFQSIIKNTSGGSTLPIISKSSWSEIEIPYVPENKRVEVSHAILELEVFIEQSNVTLLSAQNLRTSILNCLLSGEHEIPTSYDKIIGAA